MFVMLESGLTLFYFRPRDAWKVDHEVIKLINQHSRLVERFRLIDQHLTHPWV